MTDTINGSDAILKVIRSWGVDHIYGYPGGSYDSGMNAIYNQKKELKFIRVRHEEAGALAASAEAKLTGKIGVCFGSSGPGAAHLLNGLYDARSDHAPVLAMVAQVPSTNMNLDFFQAVDEEPMFEDVANAYCKTAITAESLPRLIDDAIRHAYKYHGVAAVIIPKDFGWAKIKDNYITNANNLQKPIYPEPDPDKIDKAYNLIKNAKAPELYFGLGAKNSRKELEEISKKFKMPLVSSVPAKGVVPNGFKGYLGSEGRVGSKPASETSFNADVALEVGEDVPFSIFYFPPKTKVIQIDTDIEKLGKRHPTTVGILADAKKSLQALLNKGKELKPTAFYKASLADMDNWEKWHNSFIDSKETPVRPEPIYDVLDKTASDKAIFTVDVGNSNINFERLINMHDDQKWTLSGQHATMGYAVPAGQAAKIVYPDRDVYTLSGEGAFPMMGQEILTQIEYNLHVINIVFSNGTLGYIEGEQRDDTHQPLSGVYLPDTNWEAITNGFGAKGYTARNKQEFKNALEDAKSVKGPVVIDVKLTHEMPLTTQHMYIDPAFQDQKKIDEFVKKYKAQSLKPFSYFLKKAKNEQL